MYIDLVVLLILLILVIMFFRRFSSFVFFMAIVDIFLRLLTFIKNNCGVRAIYDLINRYFPENMFIIINKYTGNITILNIILKWAFFIIMCFFFSYIVRIFLKKKKI